MRGVVRRFVKSSAADPNFDTGLVTKTIWRLVTRVLGLGQQREELAKTTL